MKILLGDFNAKLGRERIERLHQDSNDSGVRIDNFVTSKKI